MSNKVWYQSKTVWVNLGGTLVTILTSADVMPLIPPKYAPLVVALVAVINIALRASQTQGQGGLTISTPPPEQDAVSGATIRKIGMVLLAIGLSASISCAPLLRPKVDAVASFQTMQILFDSVDDGARILCFGTTSLAGLPHPWHCTAGTPGVTDVVYQRLADKLVSAYDTQIRLGPVLKGLKEQDTLDVADLLALERTAGEIHDLAAAIQPSGGVAAWAGSVQRWLASIQQAKAILGGAK